VSDFGANSDPLVIFAVGSSAVAGAITMALFVWVIYLRWQRGLAESLTSNIGLLLNPRGGAVGWLAFPFLLLFEFLGPLLEVSGYLFMGIA
jgi:hypothetical protein